MFSTDARTLKAALSKVLPVVRRRVTIPILAHVRLRVAQDLLTVSGTDLDTQIDAEALVEGVPAAEATVDPRPLLGILRLLAGSTAISVTKEDDGVHLNWRGGHAKLASLDAAQFPDLKLAGQSVSATLDGAVPKALARVLPFVSTEETRYYLNGLAIAMIGGRACLVATDGRRLCAMPGGATLEAFREKIAAPTLIIPRAAATFWLQMFPVGEVTATAAYRGENDKRGMIYFEVSANGLRLRTKTIDGSYPQVEKVIPNAAEAALSVNLARAELIAACRMATAVAVSRRDNTEGTLRAADGRLSLSAKTLDADAIALDLGESSATFEYGLNLAYLASAISAARGATVTLHANGSLDPILVRGSDDTEGEAIVIMTLRTSVPTISAPAPLKAAA